MAPSSHTTLDGRTKPRTRINFGRRTNRIGLLRASGSFASRRGLNRANGHSRAAARCRVSRRVAVSPRARAVGEARFRNRTSGLSDRVGVRFARRGTPARRRVSGVWVATVGHGRSRGLFTAGALTRSSVRVTRSLGSSRAPCWGHQHRSRQSVASPSRRLAGHPKCRGLFAQSRRGMAHSDIRVTRSVRGERPERFTSHRSGFVTVGITTRRSAGHSRVVALSGVLVSRAHSKDRPTRKWSRRAQRSGAILSPRRAAHLQRRTLFSAFRADRSWKTPQG